MIMEYHTITYILKKNKLLNDKRYWEIKFNIHDKSQIYEWYVCGRQSVDHILGSPQSFQCPFQYFRIKSQIL